MLVSFFSIFNYYIAIVNNHICVVGEGREELGEEEEDEDDDGDLETENQTSQLQGFVVVVVDCQGEVIM